MYGLLQGEHEAWYVGGEHGVWYGWHTVSIPCRKRELITYYTMI